MGELLSKGDLGRLSELERMLANLQRTADDPDVDELVAGCVGVDAMTNMRFEHDQDRLFVSHLHSAGPCRIMRQDLLRLQRGIASGDMRFLFSSPVPESAQRNRLAEFSSIRFGDQVQAENGARFGLSQKALDSLRPGVTRLIRLYEDIGIAGMHNARILVCDGPLLLRYTSIVNDRPFTRRQRALFVRCTDALRRRTVLDHRLGTARDVHCALTVALETFGTPTFLVERRGRVVHANQLGIRALDREHELTSELKAAICGRDDRFDVHAVQQSGAATHFLVVRRCVDLAQVAAAFAMEHGFSGRGKDVFIAAASGESTKHIAARLGVAHNTVEYHLTRVFRAVGVSSRAELQRLLAERLLGTRASH